MTEIPIHNYSEMYKKEQLEQTRTPQIQRDRKNHQSFESSHKSEIGKPLVDKSFASQFRLHEIKDEQRLNEYKIEESKESRNI